MRVLIITDLEGISGVDSIECINMESEAYRQACHLLMGDTNAAIDGAFAAGATEVVVLDGHGGGRNFIKEELDPRAVQLPAADFSPRKFEQNEFDALMCVGCHAMAGTEKAFLDHTQSSLAWFDYQVGGISYGEIGQQAIWAGSIAVPLVMVCGDEKACEEANALIPNVATASVKTANYRNTAICYPLEKARKRIYDAAMEGVRRCKEVKPFVISLPTTVQITFTRNDYCDNAAEHAAVAVRNGRTLTKTLNEINSYLELVSI